MTIDQLINQLVTEGGAIVSSSVCSEMEIADAQATGRFSVREDGMGFVRRYPEWLALQLERAAKLSKWESGAAEILPPGSDCGESGVPEMFFDSFEELKKEKAWLIEKGEKLVRWVESARHTHEEVRDHNGRLKDTGIWAQFYVAVRGIQRKDTPKPSGQNSELSR